MRGLIAVPSDRYLDDWPESAAVVAADEELAAVLAAEGSMLCQGIVDVTEWPNTAGQVLLVWEAWGPDPEQYREEWLSGDLPFHGGCRLLTADEWALVAAGKAQELVA